MNPNAYRRKIKELLEEADMHIGGDRPWDVAVHDDRFFAHMLGHGSLGAGESYILARCLWAFARANLPCISMCLALRWRRLSKAISTPAEADTSAPTAAIAAGMTTKLMRVLLVDWGWGWGWSWVDALRP